ncbi:MAG: hypothetical protein HS126_10555 [Anaerolineales bacterium]|nr:hypothetical protein [Anaerolineales bacterium]
MEYIKTGDNCLIMPNVIIQPFAEIGNDVIIWGGSCIGYQSRIGDHSYIAPGGNRRQCRNWSILFCGR